MENLGEESFASQNLEEVKTTDIESEEVDIFERKHKFDELLKRLEKHRKETMHLRGNDLRYNIYMKKLQKLTRMDLGLDIEAYKDFINNLKQFAHVNSDFEIFARDALKIDDPMYKQIVELSFANKEGHKMSEEDAAQFAQRSQEIESTLRKLRREARAFLTKKDKELLEDFIKNMRTYMFNFTLFDITKAFYDKRQIDLKNQSSAQLDLAKVNESVDLEQAGLSKRDFDNIKALLKLDSEIFKPSELGSFSPYSQIIDISKYDG